MWSSVALVAVALLLAAAWWVAASKVSSEAAARSDAGVAAEGGRSLFAKKSSGFHAGGKGSAFTRYVPRARASFDAGEQEGMEQQRIGRMPSKPQLRPVSHPPRRLSGQQEMLRQFYEQSQQKNGAAAPAASVGPRKGVESPAASASRSYLARDSQRGAKEAKKEQEKEDEEEDDGLLGRKVAKRLPFEPTPRGMQHRTPPRAAAAPRSAASTPYTMGKAPAAASSPSTTMRTGHHSTTADVVRLYSSPSKFTGRGTNNTQLVTFFADQEQSLAMPAPPSGSPLRVMPRGRRFEDTTPRKLAETSGQDEWAAANQRIKQEYDELANRFTAELTKALDAAAQVPREIVLGYMKEEEIKAAKAAAEAQLKREAAQAKLISALTAPQPSLAELQEAIREAEEAEIGDTQEAKLAIGLVRAATKVCELLTTAVQEGDTARLAQICQSIAAEERFNKLINPRNDRLQRLVNNANRIMQEEQEQRARRQLEEQKRQEAPQSQQQQQQRPSARFGTAAGMLNVVVCLSVTTRADC